MTETISIGKKLRIAGLLIAIIGLLIGVLFAITIGKSCGFLGGLIIVFSFLVSFAGGVLFVSGLFIEKRSRRSNTQNQLNSASR